jgi:hypothetical protein
MMSNVECAPQIEPPQSQQPHSQPSSLRIVKDMTCFTSKARRVRALVLAYCVGFAGIAAVHAHVMLAQQQQPPRVVQGKVVDKSEAGLKGATVYLKDGHTLAVKSYVTGDDGVFRFGQLTPTADYQVWAEFPAGGKKSSVKNISSFDSRTEFNITLKIDTGK